ncbi:DNA-binding transcriptional activator TdcA [Serratia silvae]
MDNELGFERLMGREYKVVVRKGHSCENARMLKELQHCDWAGSYYRLLHELFGDMAPAISVTCETFMVCTSLVAQSDFVSILSVDVISDPILGRHLVALELDKALPYATCYLIQRKDTTLTPMGAYLARLFRQHCR